MSHAVLFFSLFLAGPKNIVIIEPFPFPCFFVLTTDMGGRSRRRKSPTSTSTYLTAGFSFFFFDVYTRSRFLVVEETWERKVPGYLGTYVIYLSHTF